MATEVWFYERQGQQNGPVTETEMLELRKREEIGDTSLVWKEGMDGWIPYRDSALVSLESAAPAASPAGGPPPVRRNSPPNPFPGNGEPFVPGAAVLRPDSEVAIGSCLGRGWRFLCSDFWPLVGYCALITLIIGVVSQLGVTVLFLMSPLMAGIYFYLIKRVRGKTGVIDDLFEGFRRRFGDLAIVNLITSLVMMVLLLVVGGVIAAVIVGVLASVDFSEEMMGGIVAVSVLLFLPLFFLVLGVYGIYVTLATLLCIDCDVTYGTALSLSWRATKRHWFKLMLFGAVTLFLGFVGVLVLYVGAFVTGAWTMIATVYLYQDMFGESSGS